MTEHPQRVLVCGGRDYNDEYIGHYSLSKYVGDPRYHDPTGGYPTIIHGGCPTGADSIANSWAKAKGLPREIYPAQWDEFGKAAGPIRNKLMLNRGKPDLVIAFPGGKGTADMVRRAEKAGIKVITIMQRTDLTMGDKTEIEWCDATWNPIRGCTRVSEGCTRCYAERQAARFNGPGQPYEGLVKRTTNGPRWTGKVMFVEKTLEQPLRWKRPRRIFVNSMSDLFHDEVDVAWVDKIFAVMALSSKHTFIILTKRADGMRQYVKRLARSIEPLQSAALEMGYTLNWQGHPLLKFPIPNVWLGVSVEDQTAADERIPDLLETPAAVRLVSAEPLLGPINFESNSGLNWLDGWVKTPMPGSPGHYQNAGTNGPPLDWVIAGGESGPDARPIHPQWVRDIRDQCQCADVPYFFKQWGAYGPEYVKPVRNTIIRNGVSMYLVGKKAAGKQLDGRTWTEFPDQDRT